MVKTSKQTPLTLEAFEKVIMPVLNKKFTSIDKQFTEIRKDNSGIKNNLIKLTYKINDLTEDVSEIKENVKYLPTTEVYLKSQDELMGELQKAREASEFTGQHYRDTNDRIDNIDRYTGFNSNIL